MLTPLSGQLSPLTRSGKRSSLLSGLVSYWKLDEASAGVGAVTRLDSYGGNGLTDNNNVASAAGIIDQSAVFASASSKSLSIASNASLQVGGTDFTLTCWLYITTASSGVAIAKADADKIYGYEYLIAGTTSRLIRVGVGNGTFLQVMDATNFGALTLNTWYFITMWYVSGGSPTLNVSVNNSTPQSVAGTVAPIATNKPFSIGGITGVTGYLNGRVDEAGLWKRTLTSTERALLYNSGSGKTYPF